MVYIMLKFLAWVIVLLCTTAVSCRKAEGFPLLKSRDFNLSGSVVQGHDIHVWRHAGLNRTVSSAKGDVDGDGDGDKYYKQHHKFFQSKKSKGGKGANGGANVPHHSSKKNAAPSLLNPPCFLLTVTLHVIFTVIL
ncbi:hypothetical protein V6N11_029938 [Hibiscus sabdariffa]|uniref:Uncharacterized protein n=1 Tax=Hibiscus sabdariffa TaxID=183260 RepID=A0ABR2PJD0_9ROSI